MGGPWKGTGTLGDTAKSWVMNQNSRFLEWNESCGRIFWTVSTVAFDSRDPLIPHLFQPFRSWLNEAEFEPASYDILAKHDTTDIHWYQLDKIYSPWEPLQTGFNNLNLNIDCQSYIVATAAGQARAYWEAETAKLETPRRTTKLPADAWNINIDRLERHWNFRILRDFCIDRDFSLSPNLCTFPLSQPFKKPQSSWFFLGGIHLSVLLRCSCAKSLGSLGIQ